MTDTLFHFLMEYSSLKVFLFGLLGASSFLGTGRFFFDRLFGKRIPSHYALPGSMLLGLLSYSLLLQAAGFAHAASHSVLKTLLCAQLGLGNALLLLSLRPSAERSDMPAEWRSSLLSSKTAMLLAFLLGLSLFVNLIIALAPSTKADEVYVYMHVPLRMLQDGGIFYERIAHIHIASWIPQLHYQLIAAPFYALGLTDALNVVSWCLSLLFVFFIVRTIYEKTSNTVYSLLIALGLYVGMHSPVWYVTGGAGAFSVLSMTVLTYMTLDSRALAGRFGSFRLLGMASLFSMATTVSKLTYLPVAFFCLAICALLVWQRADYRKFWTVFAVSVSFWAVFYLPAFLWSWSVSGFFFGPMSDPANAAETSMGMASWSWEVIRYEVAIALAELSPFVWGGCMFFFALPWMRKERFAFASASFLFTIQIALFVWKLPLHFRYFGGLHFGLALFFWANTVECCRVRFLRGRRLLYACASLFVIPWLFLQLWYSSQFFPVVFNVQSAGAFVERLTPFYADFAKLDELLPKDAVLLVNQISMPVYAPRRVVHAENELPLLKDTGLPFAFGYAPTPGVFPDYTSEAIYQNNAAVHHAFRTPGRAPVLGPLTVYRLEKSAETEVKE